MKEKLYKGPSGPVAVSSFASDAGPEADAVGEEAAGSAGSAAGGEGVDAGGVGAFAFVGDVAAGAEVVVVLKTALLVGLDPDEAGGELRLTLFTRGITSERGSAGSLLNGEVGMEPRGSDDMVITGEVWAIPIGVGVDDDVEGTGGSSRSIDAARSGFVEVGAGATG